MVLVLEDDFEFILATFSLMTTVNHFVKDYIVFSSFIWAS